LIEAGVATEGDFLMRVFHIQADQFQTLTALPEALPPKGYLWIASTRAELENQLAALQAALQRWVATPLVDLHVSDLLNQHLPSHFEDTSWYDLLVFHGLVARPSEVVAAKTPVQQTNALMRQVLASVQTDPLGFVLFDRILLTVHPEGCAVRDFFTQRLAQQLRALEIRNSVRIPPNPADLMLRIVNHMVDSYLDLRRLLSRELGGLQQRLFERKGDWNGWQVLLEARNTLRELDNVCEDQRSAVTEWIDALDEWPDVIDLGARRERELIRLRSLDVLEHVERVLSHVRRLESSSEAAVQMHFAAQSHRTNNIMRTLTVLTAIFLPLNLVTGFFGMNFDGLPLIHSPTGFWVAASVMVILGVGLAGFFWRKRYLGSR
jgi:magnesium transporter